MNDIARKFGLAILLVFIWVGFIMCGAYQVIKVLNEVEANIHNSLEEHN